MTFQEKVQSMTASQIIMAMVKALTHPPIVRVDMSTYGDSRWQKLFGLIPYRKVCFGCAATNTICEISGKRFKPKNIQESVDRANFLNCDWHFLARFEMAINDLRCGNLYGYNQYARNAGFATIQGSSNFVLPYLSDDYTNDDLVYYKKLADEQVLQPV